MINLTRKTLKLLDKFQKKKLIIIVILMFIGAISESLGVSLIYPLISAITNNTKWKDEWYAKIICAIFGITNFREYILVLILILIIVFCIKNVYLMLERYIQNSYIAKSRSKMQKKLIVNYMQKPYEYFLKTSSGEIIRIITSDTVQVFNLLTNIMTIFTESFVCVVIGITLLVMNPLASAYFILLMIAEMFLLTKIIRPKMSNIGKRNYDHSVKANEWIIGAISGIKSIKVSNTSDFFINMYSKSADKMVDSQRKSETINTIPKVAIETITVEAILIMILTRVLTGYNPNLLIPLLSSFAIAALRLLPCVSTITNAINGSRYEEVSLDKILNVLNEESINSINVCEDNARISFKKNIEMRNITFGYNNSNKKILENASINIKYGQSVGIIGASGAGKTTTIDILLGLLKPRTGGVFVDGVNIENNINSWLSNLAYIPQQIFIMDDSIKSNVAFGVKKEEIDETKVWEALRDSQLDDFVKELPDGLNSRVGEDGSRISGGQRQRIAIARALYNNPKLLIFDEATSSLDNETEKAIINSINNLKGKKTMVIVAHRLTTIENCDVIYRIENGNINRIENIEK